MFNNWEQIDSIPPDAKLLGYGQDFGFTNHPTALIALYKWNGKLILDEKLYRKGMLNSEIAKFIKTLKRSIVVADSAEPKSIAEIKSYGVNIVGADKGKGSINFGIELLQEFEMLVTSSSLNLIKELRNYKYVEDREGQTTNEPIDDFNHLIDALRYIATKRLKNNYKRFSRLRA